MLFLKYFLTPEIITYTPFCMYILRVAWILLYLLPKPSYMYVHRPRITRVLVSPDDVQEVLSAVHFIRILSKKLKKIEFLRCQVDFLLSQSIDISPFTIMFLGACTARRPPVRRMIALMRAFTSRILNGLVI